MIDLFKQHHLNLEIKCNLKIVDYVDITFDLTTGLFKPYSKTNNIPICSCKIKSPAIYTERNTEICL